MRDIMFRGKRTDTGEWVYGYLLADTADCSLKKVGKCVCPHDGSAAEIWVWIDDLHEYDCIVVDALTVEEYTGLRDKDGNRVFENDILFDSFGSRYGVVRFGEYTSPIGSDPFTSHIGFYVEWSGKNKYLVRTDLGYWLKKVETTRVVGNIHDNEDLLHSKSTEE